MGARFRVAAIAVCAIAATPVLAPSAFTATRASASTTGSPLGDTTGANNPLRTAWDQAEPNLSPTDVDASSFGQLFSTQLDGQIYAQPLVVDRTASSPGKVIVATENDNVYGVDPVDGSKDWTTSLGTAWSSAVLGCGDLTPTIGVTSTPVYDPSTNTIYVMAKDAPSGANSTTPRWQLHALDADNGFERAGWPVTIGGHPDNDPTRTFNKETAAQRPGLLLLDGVVYAGFASYCDHSPYVGYVVGVSTTSATQTAMFSMVQGSSGGEAGIWQSGGGLVSDGTGQIIVTTGNGDTAPIAPSNAPPAALSEAVVRLGVQGDGTLKATDWFSPSNGLSLNQMDADLGSGAPMGIPTGYGSTSHPHLLVQVGKDGRLFLLDRDKLGGNSQGPGGTDAVLGQTQLGGGVWGHPAFWADHAPNGTADGYVYIVENSGYLRALKLGENGDGDPVLVATANSANTFGYTSGSPVVTSDGTTPGSALVWVVGVSGPSGGSPMLQAYNANPDNGVLDQTYSAPLNPPGVTNNANAHGSKFSTVATDNGRVFVGTRDGVIFGFGHPSSAPIYAPRTDVGTVAVGTTSSPATVTLTASRPVTVTGVSASSPFTVTDAPPSSVVLAKDDPLTVHLTLHPTSPGSQTGTLTIDTLEGATAGSVSFGVDGYGTQPGLSSYPSSLDFGTVPIPGHKTEGVNLVNTSGVAETVTAVGSLATPFTSTDLPTVSQVIPAGASVAVPLAYSPTATSAGDAGTLSVTVDPGAHVLTVNLTGSAVTGAAQLDLEPTSLDFGLVPRGQSVTKTFEIANDGNILLTINKAKAPFGAFTTTTPVAEGQSITPDQSVIQSVTFSPTAKGVASATYQVTGDDGSGVHSETLTGIDDQLTDRYLKDAELATLLGAPRNATHVDGDGFSRRFTNGRMYWSTNGGVREMHGPVLHRYLALGGTTSPAGYPSSDVTPLTPNGARTTFAHGWAIYWSKPTGAWAVHGRTGAKWRAVGAQHSELGFPTSNPVAISHGFRQRFAHGTITWTKADGYTVRHRS